MSADAPLSPTEVAALLEAALATLRAGEASVVAFRNALTGAREAAALAPVYWRSRGPLTQYLEAAEHIDHALRNGR
ncbi:MAG TPA: hypothetical protein VFL90_18790, partial [Methylomirabilota bacterium]|nr:hypothetical protein [Methylomirabilota bacterium]